MYSVHDQINKLAISIDTEDLADHDYRHISFNIDWITESCMVRPTRHDTECDSSQRTLVDRPRGIVGVSVLLDDCTFVSIDEGDIRTVNGLSGSWSPWRSGRTGAFESDAKLLESLAHMLGSIAS